MLFCILRAPLSFFDQTPVGRMINRFSKDVTIMDMELYSIFDDYLGFLLAILGGIILVYAELPIMILALIPAVVVFVYIRVGSKFTNVFRSPFEESFAERFSNAQSD